MTKAELLAAIADVPDDAEIYIDPGDGVLRSSVNISYEEEDGEAGFVALGWIEEAA